MSSFGMGLIGKFRDDFSIINDEIIQVFGANRIAGEGRNVE